MRFRVKIEGGKADKNKVGVIEFLHILDNFQNALFRLGNNLAKKDEIRIISEIAEECKLDVVFPFKSGSGIMELEISNGVHVGGKRNYGERSVESYVGNLNNLRNNIPPSEECDDEVLGFMGANEKLIENGYKSIEYSYSENEKLSSGVFDNKVNNEISKHIKRISYSIVTKIDKMFIEGTLYSVSDPKFFLDKGEIVTGLRTDSGDIWVCIFDKSKKEDLRKNWDSRVRIIGNAEYMKTQRKIFVDDMIPITQDSSALESLRKFEKMNKDVWDNPILDMSSLDFIKSLRGHE